MKTLPEKKNIENQEYDLKQVHVYLLKPPETSKNQYICPKIRLKNIYIVPSLPPPKND